MEPQAVAQMIEGKKEARDAVDMSLEMLNVQALDTGRYQAMIIQDPTDKRSIKGYLHLVLVHVLPLNRMTVTNALHTDLGIKRLIDSLNEWTDIEANIAGRGDLTSPETLQTPWIYTLAYRAFELTQAENEAVGKYTTSGGFLFCDEGIRVRNATYISVPRAFREMFASGFETQDLTEGRDWHTGKVPPNHPLFHCYFDFQGLPGSYFDRQFVQSGYLRGAVVQGRLVAILSNKAIPWLWGVPDDPQLRSERFLQLGINTIIFALTQEGSITHRLMDSIQ